MVNGGFPEAFCYGFEMVDGPLMRPNLHQSKIYAESNRGNFSRFAGGLTSMQTLAIYRRLLVLLKAAAQKRRPG